MAYPSNSDDAYGVTAVQVKNFIERVEQLNSEIKDIQDQRKEVFAEAKGSGFDTAVLRDIIRDRKKNADELAEKAAIKDMYTTALSSILD